MKGFLCFLLLIITTVPALFAQQNIPGADTVLKHTDTLLQSLPEVSIPEITVTVYELNKSLLETPASVNVITTSQFNQSNNTSILSAVNATPGVRMEERSPGSYRFAIRGSALQSPYGISNIQVYYNDIPFTEAGGNTYLNQLGFYNFQSLQIIKGPGSSLYGASIGGVLLINSIGPDWKPGADIDFTTGSYNLYSTNVALRLGDSSFKNVIRYQHVTCNGYRQQSNMHKDVVSWDAEMSHSKNTSLSAHFLFGNLYYQTPGALMADEYNTNPQLARPATATTAGAVESNAAIYQKTVLAGFTCKQQFSNEWSNSTTLFGDYSTQLNPNIRNYSRTSEPNYGGRSTFKYEKPLNQSLIQWITGAEYIQSPTDDRTFNNINGTPQNLQSDQEINNSELFGFTQLTYTLKNWQFTAGVSVNRIKVSLSTLSNIPFVTQERTFTNEAAPRIAVLRKITGDISAYASAEKGFSPPTVAELAPTGSAVNFGLNAEQGWNYEAGIHAYAFRQRLFIDISLFDFQLKNTIVQRRDSSGQDYYLNAGSTKQKGAELYADYKLLYNTQSFINNLDANFSFTGNDFHYGTFRQLTSDYSGNQMPGIAPVTLSAGIRIGCKAGFYVDINGFCSGKIALNDANSAHANEYCILDARIGWKRAFDKNRYNAELYAGVNNLLNQRYSLGNDINAAGEWYYNAAPPANYFCGIHLGYNH